MCVNYSTIISRCLVYSLHHACFTGCAPYFFQRACAMQCSPCFFVAYRRTNYYCIAPHERTVCVCFVCTACMCAQMALLHRPASACTKCRRKKNIVKTLDSLLLLLQHAIRRTELKGGRHLVGGGGYIVQSLHNQSWLRYFHQMHRSALANLSIFNKNK